MAPHVRTRHRCSTRKNWGRVDLVDAAPRWPLSVLTMSKNHKIVAEAIKPAFANVRGRKSFQPDRPSR